MTDSAIKIMIVDDHPFVRRSMRKVIEREERLSVIHEAGSAEEAIRLIRREEPDLAIVDISLESEASGLDLIKILYEQFPRIKILVLSMHAESLYAERAFRAGAHGYITKKEAPSTIISTIRTLLKGKA